MLVLPPPASAPRPHLWPPSRSASPSLSSSRCSLLASSRFRTLRSVEERTLTLCLPSALHAVLWATHSPVYLIRKPLIRNRVNHEVDDRGRSNSWAGILAPPKLKDPKEDPNCLRGRNTPLGQVYSSVRSVNIFIFYTSSIDVGL